MSDWTLRLFGGARVERDGTPLEGPATQRQRLALLATIGTSPNGLSRERALGLLWPDAQPDRARHALSNAVYALKQSLPDDVLLTPGDDLRLNPEGIRVDVVAFEKAIAAGEFEAAATLYSGPFLDGFRGGGVDFEHWADAERARLARRYREVLDALAREAEADGRLPDVVRWRRAAAEADPFASEEAVALLRALIDAGDPIAAIRHARTHEALLADELEVPPDQRVADLSAEAEELLARGASQEERPQRVVDDGRGQVGAGALGEVGAGAPKRPERPWTTRWRTLAAAAGIVIVGVVAGLRSFPGGAMDPIERVAVLPLANLSALPDQEYFADAMTELLTAELARIDGLEVVSRTTAQRFRGTDLPLEQVAAELGVDAVIEGSVFRSDEDLLITAQLIAVGPERHLWAESYEGRVGEAIELQRGVARAVARTIQRELGPSSSSSTGADEALDLYFLGMARQQKFTPEGVRASIESLEAAVAIDSTFGPAWSKLAESYWMLTQPMDAYTHHEGMTRARVAAESARSLDPTDALATTVLGWVQLFHSLDAAGAETLFRRAVRGAPQSAAGYAGLSFALSAQGRHDEAIDAGRRARALEPLVLSFRSSLAEVLLYARRYTDAEAEVNRTLALDPSFHRARTVGRWIAEAEERWSDALMWAGPDWPASPAEPLNRQTYWGAHLEAFGQEGLASAMDLAWIHAGLGDAANAVALLEAAREAGDGGLVLLGVAPQWDGIRDHPGFQRLLRSPL